MAKCIALLRGINVAGQKKIKMADLQRLLLEAGFLEVSTYIQSGNVIFSHHLPDKDAARNLIEQKIADAYGFNVAVQVFSPEALEQALANMPFEHISLAEEGARVMFTFLSKQPEGEDIEAVQVYLAESESLKVNKQVAYLYCPNGYGKTKLSNAFLEKKLSLTATSRNLKTVVKLNELLRG